MASPVTTQTWRSNNKLEMWDHDPGDTNANAITPDGGTTERWLDMRDYNVFTVAAMSSSLTGNGISLLEIVASDSADGSTNVTQIKTSGAVVADAVGDWVVEECLASELAERSVSGSIDPGLRYVTARITVANGADEAVVATILSEPRFPQADLTADTIS